jgi:antitoxin Phd
MGSTSDLGDTANLGLTLAGSKLLLAQVQQQIVAVQANIDVTFRPDCRSCGGTRQVKDWPPHRIATSFEASIITRHVRPDSVLISFEEWQRLSRVPSFGRLLMAAPLAPDDLPPRQDGLRDTEF